MCFLSFLKRLFDGRNRISKDATIRKALQLLPDDVVDPLLENSVEIRWHNLSFVQVSHIYACRAKDIRGNNLMLLHTLWKKAPAEQLACLIAHESCHKKDVTDLQEETVATCKEAETWKKLRKDEVLYKSTDLYERLEKLARMSKRQIAAYVKASNFYEKTLVI